MTEDQEPDPDHEAQHDDAGALHRIGALYRDYAEPLRRYVCRVTASRGLSEALVDTDGVVNETFASMLGTLATIENPRAWLFTVSRRLVGKIAAEHRRRAEGDPQELLHADATRWTSLTACASTEDIVEAREVLTHLAELPDRQRIAVYLRHVQGWSAAEISDYLNCAQATVHVHIHRGKRSLQIALAAVVVLTVLLSPMTTVTVPTPGGGIPYVDSLDPTALLVVWVLVLVIAAVVKAIELRRSARHHDRSGQAPADDD